MGRAAFAAATIEGSDLAAGMLPLQPAVSTGLRDNFGGTTYHDGRDARAGVVDEDTGCSGCSSGGSTKGDRADRTGDAGVEAGGDGTGPPRVASASVCAARA